MHAIQDGYRGLQVLVNLNADRLFFLGAIVGGILAGTLGASLLSAVN